MNELSDKLLVQAYIEAKRRHLNTEFLLILQEEIERRHLQIDDQNTLHEEF
ncbi:sporulation histidine kinase inhibitor Sda [Lentibacillus persicus]|uniref:sporulation histidine kinase inhibitor Sda n=1 Tax=Lentibacillus persicus TaxID=640948 RepID=UPI000B7C7A66|nr:sporulation histidine kinase inhibitor Sda [Lentibacillus persicus]